MFLMDVILGNSYMNFLLCMVKMINFCLPYKTGNSGFDLNMLLEVIKNIDLNALSSSLGSIEKVLNVASTF